MSTFLEAYQYALLQVLPTSKYYGGNWEGMPLPFSPSDLEGNEMINNTLDSLTDFQLEIVLARDGVVLRKYRKKVLFDPKRHEIRHEATRYNLDFTHEEFATFIPKRNILDALSSAKNLSWVHYEAIADLVDEFPPETPEYAAQNSRFYLEQLLEKVKDKKGKNVERQVLDLKLYRLARDAVPLKKNNLNEEFGFLKPEKLDVPAELYFLNNYCFYDDRWKTFMEFSKAWRKQKNSKQLEKFLPTIFDFEDDEYYELEKTEGAVIDKKFITLQNQQYLL